MSHVERQKRRKAIAYAINFGMSVYEASRQFKLSAGAVREAAHEHGIPLSSSSRLTTDRRKSISLEVAGGRTPSEVAADHGLSIDTVIRACRSNNVSYTRSTLGPGSGHGRPIQILADLISKTMNQNEIAKKHRITRQAVDGIKTRAIEAGIPRELLE
jgi:transposase